MNDGGYGSEFHKLRADGLDDSLAVFGRPALRKHRTRLRPARPRDSRCVGHPEAVRRLRRAGRKRNLEHPDHRPGHGTDHAPDHQARARQYVSNACRWSLMARFNHSRQCSDWSGVRGDRTCRKYCENGAPAPKLADGEDTICLMMKTGGHSAVTQGRREGVPRVGDGVLLVYREPAPLSARGHHVHCRSRPLHRDFDVSQECRSGRGASSSPGY